MKFWQRSKETTYDHDHLARSLTRDMSEEDFHKRLQSLLSLIKADKAFAAERTVLINKIAALMLSLTPNYMIRAKKIIDAIMTSYKK